MSNPFLLPSAFESTPEEVREARFPTEQFHGSGIGDPSSSPFDSLSLVQDDTGRLTIGCFDRWFMSVDARRVPQRLKPLFSRVGCGTAEAVPLSEAVRAYHPSEQARRGPRISRECTIHTPTSKLAGGIRSR